MSASCLHRPHRLLDNTLTASSWVMTCSWTCHHWSNWGGVQKKLRCPTWFWHSNTSLWPLTGAVGCHYCQHELWSYCIYDYFLPAVSNLIPRRPLSGLWETRRGGWCTVAFAVGLLRFFWAVTQLPWFPGCSRTVEGWLGGATLGRSAPATGGWLATLA